MVLHVTNGDTAAETLRRSGVDGTVLPWRDVLHDGPVPRVGPAELRRVRAEFIAACAWAEHADVERDFEARDAALLEASDDELVLWFEADLYDQLQLVQVIAMLAGAGRGPERVSLVCIDRHPKIPRFIGLGQLAPRDFAELHAGRSAIDDGAWQQAIAAWDAFRSDTPQALGEIVAHGTAALLFLAPALARLLAEYPWRRDGLSLLERRILESIDDGLDTPMEVFRRIGDREARPYLGDASFLRTLDALADARVPLLAYLGDCRGKPLGQQTLGLTDAGLGALARTHDHVRASGIDRWIGGVHLTGAPDWRFDDDADRSASSPGSIVSCELY